MTPKHTRIEPKGCGVALSPLSRRIFVVPAAILALGAALSVVSLIGTPILEAVHHVSQGRHQEETSQTASQASGLARPSADIILAGYLPGRWSNVNLVAPSQVDWDDMDKIETLDDNPGGELKWDPHGTGRFRVCDRQNDEKAVRGFLYRNGEEMVMTQTLPGEDCIETGPAKAYDPANMEQYSVKVCLFPNHAFTCNTSNTAAGKKWPESDDVKIPVVPSPPNGKAKSPIYADPDSQMSRAQARGRPPEIDKSVRRIHSAVVWFSYFTSIGSIFLTGGAMALKHKRGEAGAHAAKLGWLALACVIPTGALGFASLVTSVPWSLRP